MRSAATAEASVPMTCISFPMASQVLGFHCVSIILSRVAIESLNDSNLNGHTWVLPKSWKNTLQARIRFAYGVLEMNMSNFVSKFRPKMNSSASSKILLIRALVNKFFSYLECYNDFFHRKLGLICSLALLNRKWLPVTYSKSERR